MLAVLLLLAAAVVGVTLAAVAALKKRPTAGAQLTPVQTRPRTGPPVDLAQAKLDAQAIISRAREEALAARTAAAEEVSLRHLAMDAESSALDERERILRDRNHHFSQHRHSYKERRTEVDAEREALAAQMEGTWSVVAERAEMDRDRAAQTVLDRVEAELATEGPARVERQMGDAAEDATAIARNLISTAMERQNAGHADDAPRMSPFPLAELDPETREHATTTLSFLAEATSMDFAVDTERDQITLRGQDPIAREVARQVALEVMERKLQVADVNSAVLSRREGLARDVRARGERSLWEMEMSGRPELADLVGTLHYRFSYGQNALLHCEETGYLCGVLAAELGMPFHIARQAGMLHDLGKAADHDVEGSHAIIGGELLRVMGTSHDIVHAVKAHHFDEEPSTDLAMLTICADAISASRPGARRDTLSSYLARLEQLQEIATRHSGVERAFPLQAGREVRIFVKARDVADGEIPALGIDIAREIESEMQYPGMIKVTVIRETIATATAPVQVGSGGAAASAVAPAELPSGRRRKRGRRDKDRSSGDAPASSESPE